MRNDWGPRDLPYQVSGFVGNGGDDSVRWVLILDSVSASCVQCPTTSNVLTPDKERPMSAGYFQGASPKPLRILRCADVRRC